MLKEEPEGNELALYIVSDRIYQALTIWLPTQNKDDLQTQNGNLVAYQSWKGNSEHSLKKAERKKICRSCKSIPKGKIQKQQY